MPGRPIPSGLTNGLRSVLVVEAGLPLMPDGQPYQVIYESDDDGSPIRLLRDDEGNAFAWADDGDSLDQWTMDIAPREIAEAAHRLLFDGSSDLGGL